MATKDELLESIKALSVLELSELVKALEEEFGVSAAAPVAVAAAPAAAGDAPAAGGDAGDSDEVTVTLTDIGANKINVIKVVRELTNLGLREAKELVESAPAAIRENISKDDAADTVKKLEEAGATASIS